MSARGSLLRIIKEVFVALAAEVDAWSKGSSIPSLADLRDLMTGRYTV